MEFRPTSILCFVVSLMALPALGQERSSSSSHAMLDQLSLEGDLDIAIDGDSLVVRPVHQPRAGWADAARKMHEAGDDALLDGDEVILTAVEAEEWEW